MSETTTQAGYDPIPDLARLLCVAQRQGNALPGLSFTLSHLMQGLALPVFTYSDEAEAAIRMALAALPLAANDSAPDSPQVQP